MGMYWKLTFKEEMQKQGVNVSDLAKALKMSTSGVKKIFQKDDISLERFRRICQILSLDPAKLVAGDLSNGVKVKQLSSVADEYLFKEPKAFSLYCCLIAEKISLSEAMKKARLSKKEAYSYLKKLDEFGLVKWESGDKLILPDEMSFVFDTKSKAAMQFTKAHAHSLVDESFKEFDKNKKIKLAFRYLDLDADELDLLTNKLMQELDLWTKKRPYFKNTRPTSEKSVNIFLCIAPREFSYF